MTRRIVSIALVLATGLLIYYYTRETPGLDDSARYTGSGEHRVKPETPRAFTEADHVCQDLMASLAVVPGPGYPAELPWGALHQIGVKGLVPLENLLANQPLEFMGLALDRYEREVHGYTCIFLKRERAQGKLYPSATELEKIRVAVREMPFSVFMGWLEHPKLAQKIIYVEGENNNLMVVRPYGRLLGAFILTRAVDGPDAKQSGRYTIAQMGLHLAMKRSYESARDAEARGTLFLSYAGKVIVPELGDRPCYKLVRTPEDPPEEDGVNEWIGYFDCETLFQVGTVLKDAEGRLLGEYYFRDIQVNPEFPASQFTRGAL